MKPPSSESARSWVWRGVLQPALERRFGFFKGTLVVGLVWGAWHLPLNLAGYNDPSHPVWTALVIFPLATTGLAFVLAWLLRRSSSVWPCAVAHMANNLWSGVPLVKTPGWWAGNVCGMVALAVIVAALVFRLRRPAPAPRRR